MEINEGCTYTLTKIVEYADTAAKYGSGNLEVFATPAMIAMMENAAQMSVKPYLLETMDTVGVLINVEHTRASLIGYNIDVKAILTKIDGRRLFFDVAANDEYGEIGKGLHVRVIIDKEKFMNKLNR